MTQTEHMSLLRSLLTPTDDPLKQQSRIDKVSRLYPPNKGSFAGSGLQ